MIWFPRDDTEKKQLLTWAWEHLPIDFGLAYPIGICRDDAISAVCVYHNFRGANLEMSIAAESPRWATKETVTLLLGWPFWTHPALRRTTAICKRGHAKSRKLVAGLGFRCEGTALDLFPDDDGVIYGMTRRWWEKSRWFLPAPTVHQQKAA